MPNRYKMTNREHAWMGLLEVFQGLVKLLTWGRRRPGWDIRYARQKYLEKRRRHERAVVLRRLEEGL
jgi:hypothetical protein